MLSFIKRYLFYPPAMPKGSLRLIKFCFFSFLLFLGFTFAFLSNRGYPSVQSTFAVNGSPEPSPHVSPNPSTLPIIVWNKDRKLTRSDFQGPVPATAPAERHAESHVGVHSTWKISTKCEPVGKSGKVKCTATINEVNAQAEFDPNQSWVKPDKQTDDLLKHEQGHFDIAEHFARKKREQMNNFVGQSESAVADTEQEAEDQATEKLEKKLMEVCDAIDKQEDALQDAYDTQTKHGTDADQQKKWDEKIIKLLE